MRTKRPLPRTVALLLVFGLAVGHGSAPSQAREIISDNYSTVPYVVSNAVGAVISDGSATPTKYAIQGHVISAKDAAGFSYFSGMTPGLTFTAAVAIDYKALAGAATSTAQVQYCPYLGEGNNGPCECGCYFPPSSPLAAYTTPGTSTELCSPTSYAITAPSTAEGCEDQSATQTIWEWVANPAAPEGFSLAFNDGTTVVQNPSSPFFFSQNSASLPAGTVVLQGGQSALDGWPEQPPTGGLICAPGSAQNPAFCGGVYEVQWAFTSGSIAQSNLAVSEIDINYYGDSTGYVPDGVLRLAVDFEWQPGAADPGGTMVWENAWSPTFEYKANNVVSFSGITYLATNGNVGAEPDQNANQWTPIGTASAAGGAAGATGPAGPAGPAGSAGSAGSQGPEGATGAAGPQGATGAAGAQGPIGPTGAQGPIGPSGAVGSQGPVGPSGPVGSQGPAGPVGPVGSQGPAGPLGPVGSQGPIGPVGPVGPQGPEGAPGATGATGAQGATGLLDTTTLTQIESNISALQTFATTQATLNATLNSQLATLDSQVTTLRSDLFVVGSAGFAALAQPQVADNYVATMESLGQDPVVALHQVAVDLGIAVDGSESSQVSSDQATYTQFVQELQAELSVATSALAGAQAQQHNAAAVAHWQNIINQLNAELASVMAGNF